MTVKEINNLRNEKGVFQAHNEASGWCAVSRDGINMITFSDGYNKFYTEKGFSKRLRKLINTGF